MWQRAFEQGRQLIASRAELLAAGATPRMLTAAVRAGHLLRVRRDHYALPGLPQALLEAVRIGGRLGCVSALAAAGVFVVDDRVPHVHVHRRASRTRHPTRVGTRLTGADRSGRRVHWGELGEPVASEAPSVGILDALAQAARCQHPWHAVASIDSALHNGLVTAHDVHRLFDALPARLSYLEPLVDARAEAGQETILRLIVCALGLGVELQVTVPGVGRVDMIVEGRLVLEADSRLAHDGWEAHVRDRGRDLALARLGFATLRPAYQHTMSNPQLVAEAVLGLLAGR